MATASRTGIILVLNAGSSSLKYAAYEDAPSLPLALKGNLSGLHHAKTEGAAALSRVLDDVRSRVSIDRVTMVGHRIVHGGREFTAPTVIDALTLNAMRPLVALAPLHQPFNLTIVEAAMQVLPQARHVACFDTAFHADQPRLARLYGLPRALSDGGIIAYGFHGLSYAYIASVLRQRYGASAGGRVIVAHLGSGVSLCALRDGRSVATTMGFSVLDGPLMATRAGSIDPGVLLHLLQARGMTPEALSTLLYEQSGWLGVSGGISDDMRTLLKSHDPRAREAIELFVYRVGRSIGSLAAALGGVERLVFTGGIGEHAEEIQARISEQAAWLRPEVLVIPTDEERYIAESIRA
jgi:acetate kinase